MYEILIKLRPYLENISIIAGVIGLPISIFALFEVRKIKSLFHSKARLPQLLSDLQKSASKLNEDIASWDKNNHLQ